MTDDFAMDMSNGISHEALRALETGQIKPEEIEDFETTSRSKESEHHRRHRALMRGYLYGKTGNLKYHASHYQDELPEEEWRGTSDYWIRGYRIARDEKNKMWFTSMRGDIDETLTDSRDSRSGV